MDIGVILQYVTHPRAHKQKKNFLKVADKVYYVGKLQIQVKQNKTKSSLLASFYR